MLEERYMDLKLKKVEFEMEKEWIELKEWIDVEQEGIKYGLQVDLSNNNTKKEFRETRSTEVSLTIVSGKDNLN